MMPVPIDQLWLDMAGAEQPSWVEETESRELAACRAVIEALPAGRYARALHVGCRTGVLTRYLASECDTLLALDEDARSLGQAELRCEDQPWVQFAAVTLREEWPESGFQLVVVDDLLHGSRAAERRLLVARAVSALAPGGTMLVRTRRRGPAEESAADRFVADCRPRLAPAGQVLGDGLRVDVLV